MGGLLNNRTSRGFYGVGVEDPHDSTSVHAQTMSRTHSSASSGASTSLAGTTNCPTSSLDMWSLGMIVLEICHGVPVWMSYKCRVVKKGAKQERISNYGAVPGMVPSGLLGVAQRDYRKIRAKQDAILARLPEILANKCHGVQLMTNSNAAVFDLLQRMLAREANERITPAEALEHEWIVL